MARLPVEERPLQRTTALVNEITRARELFAVLAPSFEHEDYCPIDDWFRKDYA
jgi:hypothetical protein